MTDMEAANWESRSQSHGVTCPHEEAGRYDIGRRQLDSQETTLIECLSTAWEHGALQPNPGLPSTPLPKRVQDSCLHPWLCWECSFERRGRNLHPVTRRRERQNKPPYQSLLHKLPSWNMRWKMQQPTSRSALMLLTMLSSSQMLCVSDRP